MGMTPQHFYTILTSCVILPTMHTTNSLHALTCSLFKHIKWTGYSALLTPQSSIDPYLPCSAAIKFHNIPCTPNIPYRPSIAHALHSFCMQARQTTSAMLSTLHIAAMHPKHKHICVSGDKMAQDVGCSAVYTCSNLELWFYYYGSFSLLELRPIDSVLDPGPPSRSALHVMLRKWTDRCTK